MALDAFLRDFGDQFNAKLPWVILWVEKGKAHEASNFKTLEAAKRYHAQAVDSGLWPEDVTAKIHNRRTGQTLVLDKSGWRVT